MEDLKSGNQQLIRNINLHNILNELCNREEISRAELSKVLGLGKSTITGLVNALIDSGCVEETGTKQSSLGRRPTSLRLNAMWKYVVAIHLDTNKVHIGIVNLKGQLVREQKFKHSLANATWEQTLENLHQFTRHTCSEMQLDWEHDILGVALAIPGVVDVNTGISVSRLQKWTEFPIATWLSRRFCKRVIVENDANALCLAERLKSGNAEVDDMLTILVEEGIGAGIISNGQMVRGVTRGAGQIGHMKMETDGPECHCGQQGCLETFISDLAVRRMFVSYTPEDFRVQFERQYGIPIEEVDEKTISRLAKSGMAASVKVLDKFSSYLGRALSTLINILNPAQIVLGGSMFEEAGDLILNRVWEVIRREVAPVLHSRLIIRIIEDGDNSFLTGIASQILNEAFEVPIYESKGPHNVSLSQYV